MKCKKCNAENPETSKFCSECGQNLIEHVESKRVGQAFEGERKQVTVLFSDLSGYTAMAEKLDPEEVKEIMSGIFGDVAQIVTKYEGFIEKFVGDAVMALFGVPKAHEDVPLRAIRAAREIHTLVEAKSPKLEGRIGQPLKMHTGINTGLVVTGNVDPEKGTHGIAGDTVNVASRLMNLAKEGEILVGPHTYSQTEGYFNFKALETITVKGKREPIQVYKVLSGKDEPSKIHRLHGVRAELIGRKDALDQLKEAVAKLRDGRGSVISICGDAGTGKSRLVEELKTSLDLDEIQWQEGYAYDYFQNIPYYPFVDLFKKTFQIKETDVPEEISQKIESGIRSIIGMKDEAISCSLYIGSLFHTDYAKIEQVSPEFWKNKLQESIKTIISALAQRAPLVVCLEDLHWADPSSMDLLDHVLSEPAYPVLFLCVYRTPFNLFTDNQLTDIGKQHQEIWLHDLSASYAQDMVKSLLDSVSIPSDLVRFIKEKVGGNPFYLEECINSLIESQTLIRDNGDWRVTRAISDTDIPSTISGVISGRIDRLEKEPKRVLQEASVIGRAFLYEVLRRVTDLKDSINQCLSGLEQLDLIRIKSLQPDLEYIFKHVLTQEVVYNGLLKKDRKEIHERVGQVIEFLFHDRLPEFYETLAFHFRHGQSLHKAVDYLMKSGEKSLRMYAVEESHEYYNMAFNLLSNKPDKSKEEDVLLIDLILKWGEVFYYRGDATGLIDLLRPHEDLALSLDDPVRLGMLYCWIGYVLFWREKYRESYTYLCKALKIGEENDSKKVIGYACTWLPYTCAELGLLEEGVQYGERAQEISRLFITDAYTTIKSLAGIGYVHFFMGERKKLIEPANILLEYSKRYSDLRSLAMFHTGLGLINMLEGNFTSGIECFQTAIQVSKDPLYSMTFRTMLSFCYLSGGYLQEAEDMAQKVLHHARKFGIDWLGTMSHMVHGVVLIAKGNMKQGFKELEEVQHKCIINESRWLYAQSEYILGSVYFQIVQGKGPKNLSLLVKNIWVLMKSVPFASRKAEIHFKKAIEVAEEIGAKSILGQATLALGLLYKAKKKTDQAKNCITEAIDYFERIEAEIFLKQAKEALASID